MSGEIKVIIDGNTVRSPDNLISKRLSYAEVAILIALIEAKGEVVNRDILMSQGWPGKIVVPNSLNMAILALRRALDTFGLGDNIITIPRGGFRLERHHVFGHIHNTVHNEAGDIVEHDSSSIRPKAEVEHPSTNNKNHTQLIPADFSRGADNTSLKKVNLLDVALIALLLLNIFVFLHLSSNKPVQACRVLSKQVVVCAIDLNEKVMIAAGEYVSTLKMKNQVLLWGEHNPHQKDGYKFYTLE
ncbi:TPA: winged helix-turn-helix domain-containing protein [Aeromonas bestiarum]|nr:winged helix-turn-helix domain-containing protein [Aeromonas bestiarum]HEH9406978.1 winged helix-turn-helix domain-containing protein [Aeromonas bestiarum]